MQIAEVARIVHFLNKHCASKLITSVSVQEDNIVYGKVACSATAFQQAMTNKTVVAAKQQGKYFWLEMSEPPHPVM
jgi:formamidopyrimidine-DNA glycosylase